MILLKPCEKGLIALAICSFAWAVQAAPLNDDLNSREELPPSGPATPGSNVGATLEPNEPLPSGFTAQSYAATAWWGLELAAADQVWYEIETVGSSFDTVLSVWTGDDYTTPPLTLVHVNDEAAEGGASRIRFLANPFTVYKVAVAGRGAAQQGNIAVRASVAATPFARVTGATFSPAPVDVSQAAATLTATITLDASQEIGSGQMVLYNPTGVPVASAPFRGETNRVSGNIASGTYRVSLTVPQGALPGTYRWNLQMNGSGSFPGDSSYGWEALSPLPAGATQSIQVINTTPVNTYALWTEANNLTGPDADPEQDFDGDGLTNLTEFALGMNPRLNSRAKLVTQANSITQFGLPNITVVGAGQQKKLRMEHARRAGDTTLSYTVQFSSDLINWTNATQAATSLATDGTYEVVAVEDVPFNPAKSRRFARLRLVR